MKRIKSVVINNFCAYDNAQFELSNGCNLLIYGENGSGKSSLYKAMKNFFDSSRNQSIPFTKNRYFESKDGIVTIAFSDFNTNINNFQPVNSGNIDEEYSFSSKSIDSTNGIPFIRTAAIVKGFLDYTDLLKVYLHGDSNPNLFDLIIPTLLGEHTPLNSGGTIPIGKQWKTLETNLFNCRTRNDRKHKSALRELPIFETQIRAHLDAVFAELNRLLYVYFNDLHIVLEYNLKPMLFSYKYDKCSWRVETDLRLQVIKDNSLTLTDYNSILNEARLSAIAICLYLASLLKMPSNIDCKVLFLDDVFIGLDSGNRLPILNILKTEFSDYQKIISTYDRQWFELAKKYVNVHEKKCWDTIEMYSTFDQSQNRHRSVIVKGDSNIERACRYLYHNTSPDYPAAANYLRKAMEELLSLYIPPHEKVDSELTQIQGYRLSILIDKFSRFLERIGEETNEVNIIKSLLHALLHPLSHYEIDSPIYRIELQLIEKAYKNLENQIKEKEFAKNCKCILEASTLVRLNIKTNVIDYHYDITIDENIICYNSILKEPKCRLKKMYGDKNGSQQKGYTPNKDNKLFHYDSLQDAIFKISKHLIETNEEINDFPVTYISMFEYYDVTGRQWMSLEDKLGSSLKVG
jgi:energy-coupling factor transporter ATP-binding protein EcfA2